MKYGNEVVEGLDFVELPMKARALVEPAPAEILIPDSVVVGVNPAGAEFDSVG